jgi:hypothetical protein
MGRTRRSAHTAGEALPLQLHIAGPQKGVRSFSRPVPPGLRRPRPQAVAKRSAVHACEQEVPRGRQNAEEAAETQEAEPPKKPVA